MSSVSVASTGARLVASELQRRLPDLQVLLKLRADAARADAARADATRADANGGTATSVSATSSADGDGRGKVAHLLEARMLEALREYAVRLQPSSLCSPLPRPLSRTPWDPL